MDDSSSSDAGISSHDDEFDRLNRIRTIDEDDFDYKIKWFFDRIEQQAAQNTPVERPQAPVKDDIESSEATTVQATPQESSFTSNPIESDSHSTHEDSQSNDENTLLGKRKHSLNSEESSKRQKTSEESA